MYISICTGIYVCTRTPGSKIVVPSHCYIVGFPWTIPTDLGIDLFPWPPTRSRPPSWCAASVVVAANHVVICSYLPAAGQDAALITWNCLDELLKWCGATIFHKSGIRHHQDMLSARWALEKNCWCHHADNSHKHSAKPGRVDAADAADSAKISYIHLLRCCNVVNPQFVQNSECCG